MSAATPVTLKDVAKAANVSVQTVSNVLNNRTQQTWPSTRKRADRVRAAAKRMGYRPNAAARAMRTRTSCQIGVLLRNSPDPDYRFTNPAAFEVILGINERLAPAGYVLSIIRIHDVATDHPLPRVFREHVLDGMIIMDMLSDSVYRHAETLVPHCLWLDGNIWRDTTCLRRDEAYAGRRAVEAMVQLGYEKILWAGPTEESLLGRRHYSVDERLRGVREAAEQYKLGFEIFSDVEGSQCAQAVEQFARVLARDTAVITYGIGQARMARNAGLHAGLRPGYDFALTCCDSVHQIDRDWPELSRMRVDRFGMGCQAADMMLDWLRSPEAPPTSRIVRGQWVAGCTAWGPMASMAVMNERC